MPDPALRRSEAITTDKAATPAKPPRLVVTARQPPAAPPKPATANTPPAGPVAATPVPAAAPAIPDGVTSSIFFTSGSDRIEPASRRRLQDIAERLKGRRRAEITLIGHSEDKGSSEFGIALAQRRVDAVADVLEGLGIPARQIRRISYGNEAASAADCATDACRQQLRRVDVRIGGDS